MLLSQFRYKLNQVPIGSTHLTLRLIYFLLRNYCWIPALTSISSDSSDLEKDGKIVMKMENSRYERDSEELEDFLHKLHSI